MTATYVDNPFRKSRINDALVASFEKSFVQNSDFVVIVIHLRTMCAQGPLTDEIIGKISRRLQRKLNELIFGRNFLRNKKAISFASFHHAIPSDHLHIIAELPARWMDKRFSRSQRTLRKVTDQVMRFCEQNEFCETKPYVTLVKDIKATIYYNNRSGVIGRLIV